MSQLIPIRIVYSNLQIKARTAHHRRQSGITTGCAELSGDHSFCYLSRMMPPHARTIVTEDEYWRMFDCVLGDVEAAIKSNYAYLTIHDLAATDRRVFDKYPHFWMVTTYALQTTFFVAFGRIFDERRDCFSIQKLVKATVANPVFFSKTARARRRKSNITKADPTRLVDDLNQAWEPTTADLKPLLAALAPHQVKFKSIYQPIRHTYFAHRGTSSPKAIETLFGKTLKADVVEILKFLHTVLWAIRGMACYAREPDLTNFAGYVAYVEGLNKQIEEFIRTLT